MCILCSHPGRASAGVALKNKQLHVQQEAEADGRETPQQKPIMKITAGVVFLLVIGSVTYHTMTYLP